MWPQSTFLSGSNQRAARGNQVGLWLRIELLPCSCLTMPRHLLALPRLSPLDLMRTIQLLLAPRHPEQNRLLILALKILPVKDPYQGTHSPMELSRLCLPPLHPHPPPKKKCDLVQLHRDANAAISVFRTPAILTTLKFLPGVAINHCILKKPLSGLPCPFFTRPPM